jgi:phosphate transport system permease protein
VMRRSIDVIYLGIATATAIVIAIAAAIVLALSIESSGVLAREGLGFVLSPRWSPSEERYGFYGVALPLVGTLAVGVQATAIAVALSVAAVVYLHEYAPRRVREAIGIAMFAMAALPTVVFGMWGLSAVAPLVREAGLGSLCARGSPTGQSVFTAALVVGLMLTPYASSVVSAAYDAVPFTYVEALHSLGAMGFERARVLLGMVKRSIAAAALLSFGRAVGETTIVALTIGSAFNLPLCPFEPAHTVSSLIASQYGNAFLYPGLTSALSAAALLLLAASAATTALGARIARAAVARGGEA